MGVNYEDELFKATMQEVDDRIRVRRGSGSDVPNNNSETVSSEKAKAERSSDTSSPSPAAILGSVKNAKSSNQVEST